MPTYQVTDPKTGRKVKLTGPRPPTAEDLQQIFRGGAVTSGGTASPAPQPSSPLTPPSTAAQPPAVAPAPAPARQGRTAADLTSAMSDLRIPLSPPKTTGMARGILESVLGVPAEAPAADFIEGPKYAIQHPVDSANLMMDAHKADAEDTAASLGMPGQGPVIENNPIMMAFAGLIKSAAAGVGEATSEAARDNPEVAERGTGRTIGVPLGLLPFGEGGLRFRNVEGLRSGAAHQNAAAAAHQAPAGLNLRNMFAEHFMGKREEQRGAPVPVVAEKFATPAGPMGDAPMHNSTIEARQAAITPDMEKAVHSRGRLHEAQKKLADPNLDAQSRSLLEETVADETEFLKDKGGADLYAGFDPRKIFKKGEKKTEPTVDLSKRNFLKKAPAAAAAAAVSGGEAPAAPPKSALNAMIDNLMEGKATDEEASIIDRLFIDFDGRDSNIADHPYNVMGMKDQDILPVVAKLNERITNPEEALVDTLNMLENMHGPDISPEVLGFDPLPILEKALKLEPGSALSIIRDTVGETVWDPLYKNKILPERSAEFPARSEAPIDPAAKMKAKQEHEQYEQQLADSRAKSGNETVNEMNERLRKQRERDAGTPRFPSKAMAGFDPRQIFNRDRPEMAPESRLVKLMAARHKEMGGDPLGEIAPRLKALNQHLPEDIYKRIQPVLDKLEKLPQGELGDAAAARVIGPMVDMLSDAMDGRTYEQISRSEDANRTYNNLRSAVDWAERATEHAISTSSKAMLNAGADPREMLSMRTRDTKPGEPKPVDIKAANELFTDMAKTYGEALARVKEDGKVEKTKGGGQFFWSRAGFDPRELLEGFEPGSRIVRLGPESKYKGKLAPEDKPYWNTDDYNKHSYTNIAAEGMGTQRIVIQDKDGHAVAAMAFTREGQVPGGAITVMMFGSTVPGMGTKMLKALQDRGRRLGKSVWLQMPSEKAIPLYERMGFEMMDNDGTYMAWFPKDTTTEAKAGVNPVSLFDFGRYDEGKGETVPLTRSERTGSRTSGIFEKTIESSIPGAGPFQRFREKQQAALGRMANRTVDGISRYRGNAEQAGKHAQTDIANYKAGEESKFTQRYKDLDARAQGVRPKTALLKSFATDALSKMEQESVLIPPVEMERARKILESIKKSPKEVDFSVMQDARSTLLSISRQLTTDGKTKGAIKKITGLIETAMDEAAKVDPGLYREFRQLSNDYRDFSQTYRKGGAVSKITKGAAEKAHEQLRTASLDDTRRLQKTLRPATMKALKARMVRELLNKATDGELTDRTSVLSKMKGTVAKPIVRLHGGKFRKLLEGQYGKQKLEVIFSKKELESMYSLMDIAEKTDSNNQGNYLAAILNASLIGGTLATPLSPATGLKTGAAAVSLNVLARVMTRSWEAAAMKKYMRSEPSTAQKAFWGARLREAITRAQREEAEDDSEE